MQKYFKNMWLGFYTVLVGMKVTLIHLFAKNVTVQYPNVHPSVKAGPDRMPPNARNRLFMDIEECNGCMGCVRACPVKCITCETVKTVPNGDNVPPLKSGGKRGLWVINYQIDFAKCCFCGLCIPPCPTGAIKMTAEFEYSVYDRKELLYTFSVMNPEEIQQKKDLLAKHQAEKKKADATKTAGEAKSEDSD